MPKQYALRPSRIHCIAAAACLAFSAPAQSLVTVDGAWFSNDNVPVGPGDSLLPTKGLYVGNAALGSLLVDGGSRLQVASLVFGLNQTGTGNGLLTGAGSRIELAGNGFDQGSLNRFEVGGWGTSQFTVAGGALLDGRANSAACVGVNHYCNNFIGNAAGSTGTFTVTGSGSQAQFLRSFVVGGLAVFHPPIDSFSFGTPGGTTRGRVEVLNGGSLTTDGGRLGSAPGGGSPTGTERSIAEMVIDGAGSVWNVTGSAMDNAAAFVGTGVHRNSLATLSITNGGALSFEGRAGVYNGINLTTNGGRSDVSVSGVGSAMRFTGDAQVLQVGRSLGSASMSVLGGGTVSGIFYLAVGRDGSFGELLVQGAGSSVHVNGTASAAANGSSNTGFIDIGRNGTGVVTVRGGGQLLLDANQALAGGTGMNLGRDAASSGTLNIDGAGSVVRLTSVSVLPGGGAAESLNPAVRVGREGSGSLNISNGGKLLLEGGAASTPTDRRSTNIYIGGVSETGNGGRGIATISGAGSELRVTGQDTFIGVGIGPQSNGQLTVSNGGQISAIGMNVGRSGGVGVLKLDGGHINFSGQQTAGNLAGAFLGLGSAGGIGTGVVGNGSTITLANMGTAGAGLSLGGTGAFPGGDGSLTLSGGSTMLATAAPGLAYTHVGRDGSGLLRVRGASSINLGDGVMTVGRLSGGDGTVIVSEASTITTGWLGVGANKTATGNVDGGTGTFVLVNSTLTASEIVIGTNGFLGGTGTITGNVTNRGIFAPGNSPGTLVIDGSFTAVAGSRMVLEVESDGAGGFNTDAVVFSAGQALDLAALKVEFRFLGDTDPNAFQASGGFDTDTFFQLKDASGALGVLAPAAFAGTQFEAQADSYTISNFSFDAATGANFVAAPVPEPGTTALLLAGLVSLVWLARRRRG